MSRLTLDNARPGLIVVCAANPEWSFWKLGQDRNGWTIDKPGDRNGRMLDPDEFSEWIVRTNDGHTPEQCVAADFWNTLDKVQRRQIAERSHAPILLESLPATVRNEIHEIARKWLGGSGRYARKQVVR